MKRIKPKGSELAELRRFWAVSTHQEKLERAKSLGVTYDTVKNWMAQEGGAIKETPKPLPADIPFEQQVEIFMQMDTLTALHEYVPQEISIEIKTDKPIALTNTADWHLGMFGVDYVSFRDDILAIRDEPGLYCAVGGDAYQNIIQAQKVGTSQNQIPVANQRGLYVQALKELKEKILYIGTGNHNHWATMATGEDWEKELARRIKVVYTKHGGKINLKVGEMVYPIFRLHKGRFNSSFNLTHSAKQYQRMYFPEARIIVIEHQHIAAIEQYRYNDSECVAIRTGTYGVYDDYAQQNGFYGAHVSNPTVILYPHKDKMIAFKDMYDAIDHLRYLRSKEE